MTRPPDSTSSVVTIFAFSTGCLNGSTTTLNPSRILDVTPARKLIVVTGSSTCWLSGIGGPEPNRAGYLVAMSVGNTVRSGTHMESNPSLSASSAARTRWPALSASGTPGIAALLMERPMFMFAAPRTRASWRHGCCPSVQVRGFR